MSKARAEAERRGFDWADVHIKALPEAAVYDCGDHLALVVDSWNTRDVSHLVNWAIYTEQRPVEAFGVTMDAENFHDAYILLCDAIHQDEARHARMFCIRQTIVGYTEDEGEITFALANGWTMNFTAETECCDASWFVLNDIEKPADLIGAVVTGLRNIKPDPEWQGPLEGSITYAFAVDTTRGTYTARMANDHGESGYYSGRLGAYLSAPGTTFDRFYVNKGHDIPFNR